MPLDVKLYSPPNAKWLIKWLVRLPAFEDGAFYREWVLATEDQPWECRVAGDNSVLMCRPVLNSADSRLVSYNNVGCFKRAFKREIQRCMRLDEMPYETQKIIYRGMVFFIVFGDPDGTPTPSSAGSDVSDVEATGTAALDGY